MSTTISPRISSFSGSGLYQTYDPSVIQAQHVQRLRVNRVAIVQALRVDHVCPKLSELGILTEEELRLIQQGGKTQQEKTRLLIDLLPTKGKSVDWYNGFREALKNPDARTAEIRRKYQILLEFLDNTLIPIPPKKNLRATVLVSPADEKALQSSYPRYDPLPRISQNSETTPEHAQNQSRVAFAETGENTGTNSRMDESGYPSRSEETRDQHDTVRQSDEQMESSAPVSEEPRVNKKALITGYFHRQVTMPVNFKALVQEPEHFDKLRNSENAKEKALLTEELEVLAKAQAVEVVYALNRRNKLPEGMELCFSHAVDEMLQDENHYHMYLKYFQLLANRYNLDILLELMSSFTSFVSKLEDAKEDDLRKQVVATGFALFKLVCEAGMYVKAEAVMLELMRYLSTNSSLENWMAVWEALALLQAISNNNGYFRDADQWYILAGQMGDKIKLMSFGQDLLDESHLFIQVSITNREQGSVGAAYSWAQAALKEVDNDNHEGQLDVLIHSATAFSMQWNVKKAEELLVQAIRIANKEFGEYSPQYVRALIHLVAFCNEFRPGEESINIARRAVEIAEVIYAGTNCIPRAQTHETLARALIAAQQCEDGEYEKCALVAYRMAMDILPSLHPKFASFKITNVYVLLTKADLVEDDEEREVTLMQAEEEAKAAMQIYKSYWGEFSLKLAQAYCLLAQVYAKMESKDKAEEMLASAYGIYVLGVPPKNNYQSLIRATLGAYYKSVGQPLMAIDYLVESVKILSNPGVYLRWAHLAFETLVACFRSTSQMAEAEQFQLAHVEWQKKNPKPSTVLTWERLHEEPCEFEDFRQGFFTLATKLKKAKRGLKNFIKRV